MRMALSAEGKTVRRMFVWVGTRVALIAIAVGALAAVALTKYIQTPLIDLDSLMSPRSRGICGVVRRCVAGVLHSGAAGGTGGSGGGVAE